MVWWHFIHLVHNFTVFYHQFTALAGGGNVFAYLYFSIVLITPAHCT